MLNIIAVLKYTAVAILLSSFTVSNASPFATSVIEYEPGTGFAIEFGSGLGYTNTLAALGNPSRMTPGQFGGPVDPFAPPYLADQLLSIGEGGFVILEFGIPILNHPNNPFGLDFLIFGNTGFNITNGDFSGGGVTDGSVFGNDDSETSVWVSEDNVTYYQLDPLKAPKVDGYFPGDGQGDFRMPVNPALQPSDFAESRLEQIRALYKGSGGGAGYDLAWAKDASGLSSVRFVKIAVHSGKIELDAATIVSPASDAHWSSVHEDFAQHPLEDNDWKVFGESSLFAWDQEHERVSVTWDSRLPNSYFYLPFGVEISRYENFSLRFEIQLDHLELGIDPEKPFTFPLALGLVNLACVTRDSFFRGSGIHEEFGPRGLVEWSYHPDSGFGATISSGLISLDNQWSVSNTFPLELQVGSTYIVEMRLDAASETLSTTMSEDGAPFGPIRETKLTKVFGGPTDGFTDVNVDAFAIASYHDGGQPSPEFAGSIFATGWVDNVAVMREQSLSIQNLIVSEGVISVEVEARAGWEYWLEQTADFIHWETRGHAQSDGIQSLQIEDQGSAQANGFYRVIGKRQ
ncbi:MAG: hypothetical protein HOH33_02545 [Verrucomicrobia bacterium]|nr:hypothetical protein [Verrucomicrobiota bacterium]